MAVLDSHFVGEVNEVCKRFISHQNKHEPAEPFESFLTVLRKLVMTCEYGDLEYSAIRDQIATGITDDSTRRRLLQTRKLDLKTAIDICRAAEAAVSQSRVISGIEALKALDQAENICQKVTSESTRPQEELHRYLPVLWTTTPSRSESMSRFQKD